MKKFFQYSLIFQLLLFGSFFDLQICLSQDLSKDIFIAVSLTQTRPIQDDPHIIHLSKLLGIETNNLFMFDAWTYFHESPDSLMRDLTVIIKNRNKIKTSYRNVYFFVQSHGSQSRKPYFIDFPNSNQSVEYSTFSNSLSLFFDDLNAQNPMLLIDTCYSGCAIPKRESRQKKFSVITSSTSVHPTWGHVFTKTLIEIITYARSRREPMPQPNEPINLMELIDDPKISFQFLWDSHPSPRISFINGISTDSIPVLELLDNYFDYSQYKNWNLQFEIVERYDDPVERKIIEKFLKNKISGFINVIRNEPGDLAILLTAYRIVNLLLNLSNYNNSFINDLSLSLAVEIKKNRPIDRSLKIDLINRLDYARIRALDRSFFLKSLPTVVSTILERGFDFEEFFFESLRILFDNEFPYALFNNLLIQENYSRAIDLLKKLSSLPNNYNYPAFTKSQLLQLIQRLDDNLNNNLNRTVSIDPSLIRTLRNELITFSKDRFIDIRPSIQIPEAGHQSQKTSMNSAKSPKNAPNHFRCEQLLKGDH